jgi:hypothetical protein
LTSSQSAASRSAASTSFPQYAPRSVRRGTRKPVRDVLEDRLWGTGFGFWNTIERPHAHFDRIDTGRKQVGVVGKEPDLTLVAVARVEVVHAVEAAQERRFAAARRTDQRRDALLVHDEIDVLERAEVAVEKAERLRFRFRYGERPVGARFNGGQDGQDGHGSPLDVFAQPVA